MKTKILFFFTSEYPFGNSETFIENEINYLAQAFDRVIIVSNKISNKKCVIPDNCDTDFIGYELNNKVFSFFSLFKTEFWKELFIIIFRYKIKITPVVFKTMMISLSKTHILYNKLDNIFNRYRIKKNDVLLYSYWANDMALAISYFGKKNNIPVVSRAHGWDVYFEVNPSRYLPYRRFLFSNLTKIFFISENGKKYYEKLFPEFITQYKVSYLGVFKGNVLESQKTNILLLVSCSNIVKVKRLDLLIDALSLINKIKIKWIHFGDGALKDKIEDYTKNNLLDKHNISYVFMDKKSNKEILDFYRNNQIDLFVNVSSSEGIPVSIMEAMSYGVPCIATNVGGNSEIVNNENGYLISDTPTPEDIANTIIEHYNLNHTEKEKKQKEAFNTWLEKFNAEKNYIKFVKEILEL